MTQQQIIDAGINYTMSTRPVCMGGAAFEEQIRQYNRNPLFEVGATWAKERLIKEACEYLESSLKHDLGYYGALDFVNTFRKVMDE
jgi:hypothetical protein